jgi:hypothetical protein
MDKLVVLLHHRIIQAEFWQPIKVSHLQVYSKATQLD